MSAIEGASATCDRCGDTVPAETATVLAVVRGGEPDRTVLCADCATIACPDCGTPVHVEDALDPDAGHHAHLERVECAKCGASVPPADAAELRNQNNPQYRKLICAPCLEETAVPSGFKVVRDVQPGTR